jgi:hypothetical protein
VKFRFSLLAAATAAVAGLAAIPASAVASQTASHTAAPAPPHGVIAHGLRYASSVRLPRTHLQHLLPKAMVSSGNWAGYAAVADTADQIAFVGANFNIPSVDCANSPRGSSGFAYASHWVGIDGYNTATVEQTGIDAYCGSGSTPTYLAWYEMYPLNPVAFTGVNPGDAITATVTFNSTNSTYHMRLNDLTNGGFISSTQSCPKGSTCLNGSGEVITEDPGMAVPQINLADFGMSNFTATRVTSLTGLSGTLSPSTQWTSSQIQMVDPSNAVMATPSGLYGGRSFNTTWNSAS